MDICFDIFSNEEKINIIRGHPDLTHLLDGCTVSGFSWSYTDITHLPDNLTVNGDLHLQQCYSLTCLSDNLVVNGSVYLYECTSLTHLPNGLIVEGDLNLEGCASLTCLPSDLVVNGDVNLEGCVLPYESEEDLPCIIKGRVYFPIKTGGTEHMQKEELIEKTISESSHITNSLRDSLHELSKKVATEVKSGCVIFRRKGIAKLELDAYGNIKLYVRTYRGGYVRKWYHADHIVNEFNQYSVNVVVASKCHEITISDHPAGYMSGHNGVFLGTNIAEAKTLQVVYIKKGRLVDINDASGDGKAWFAMVCKCPFVGTTFYLFYDGDGKILPARYTAKAGKFGLTSNTEYGSRTNLNNLNSLDKRLLDLSVKCWLDCDNHESV